MLENLPARRDAHICKGIRKHDVNVDGSAIRCKVYQPVPVCALQHASAHQQNLERTGATFTVVLHELMKRTMRQQKASLTASYRDEVKRNTTYVALKHGPSCGAWVDREDECVTLCKPIYLLPITDILYAGGHRTLRF